ncbi:hypothetical protein [Streptomyces sp. NPDC050804]|uniref:hypothetical protein n=1 Tax=Streptomyces sp. NPDC050804 TaxID=3154745 RepID=UPI0034458E74
MRIDKERGPDATVRNEDGRHGGRAEFSVIVTSAGTAFLDGRRVLVPRRHAVESVVLDALHQRARTGGEPVLVRVEDRQEGYATLLEVAPDGSSRLLERSVPNAPSVPETDPAETNPAETAVLPVLPPATASGPDTDPAGTAVRPTAPPTAEPAETAVLSVETPRTAPALGSLSPTPPVPRAAPGAPGESGSEESEASGPPRETPVPTALADTVSRINQAIAAGELRAAEELAVLLRTTAEQTFGAGHTHTVEAQGMEAYVAFLAGAYGHAMSVSLELADLRRRGRDPRAWEELSRAAMAWEALDDRRSLLHLGRALIMVWVRLSADGAPPPAQAELLERVRQDVQRLTAEQRPPAWATPVLPGPAHGADREG